MSARSYEVLPGSQLTEAVRGSGKTRLVEVLKVLIALVKADEPYSDLSVALSALDVPWLRRQGLAALAWFRFRHLPALPKDTLLELSRAYYSAVADTELHERELTQVLQALAALGCVPVVFKGVSLAFMIYPDAACRLMGDLDLWLKDDEMLPARSALEAIGYVHDVKTDRPLPWMMQNNGEVRLNGPIPGQGLVEFHWGVFAGEWLARTASVDDAGVRRRLMPVTITEQPAFVLAPEDAVLQLAMHAAINHQLSMSALRSLVDVVLLVRHQPVDWRAIIERAQQWHIAVATWLVLKLAIDLLDFSEAREGVRQLAPSKLRQWLIGRLMNADSILRMSDLRFSKWRYVYLLLLVDSKREVAKLIYRTLWPEAAWLRARYEGRSDFGLRLRHLFNAARGHI